jgi:YD repeat-containing protein
VDSPLGNGDDGIYDRVEYQYNRLGEVKEIKDQQQTIRVLEYDKLGRLVQDRVTALGSGVDGAVRRISRTYEARGMLKKITTHDNATVGSGTVLHEVQFAYNDFSQLMTEYQEHGGR